MDGFNYTTEIKVAWGDMDAFNHVNNVMYLHYFETARVEYFSSLGYLDRETLQKSGPIIANVTCNFRRPVVWPDTLIVGVRCLPPKTTSFMMEFAMASSAQDGAIVADGSAVIVNFDYAQNAKAPISDAFRKMLSEREGF